MHAFVHLFLLLLVAARAYASPIFTLPDPNVPELRHSVNSKGEILCDERSLRFESLTRCREAREFYTALYSQGLSFTDLFDELVPSPWSLLREFYSGGEIECSPSNLRGAAYRRCQVVRDFYKRLPSDFRAQFDKEMGIGVSPLKMIPLGEIDCSRSEMSKVEHEQCLKEKSVIEKMTFKERLMHNARVRSLRSLYLGGPAAFFDCR